MSDFTQQPPWILTNMTLNADGVTLNEGFNSGVHTIGQDIQHLVTQQNIGSAITMYARVRPVDRDYIWLSCRQDNGANTVWFHCVGSGSYNAGSNIASASIIEAPDDPGAYDITVTWNNLPQDTLQWTCGASTDTNPVQNYQGDGLTPFQILRAQTYEGTTPQPYKSTTDLLTIPDLATDDGAQNAILDSDRANWPNNSRLDYITGGNEPAEIDDPDYDRDNFTVLAICTWDGSSTGEKIVAEHGTSGDLAWSLSIDTDGKFKVRLSSDGSVYAKEYQAERYLDHNVPTLCTFTWDGTDLKMYYNDIELTGAELNLTVDNVLAGDLNDAGQTIKLLESNPGRLYYFRLKEGAFSQAEVAAVAAENSLSGLPVNTDPPDPDPDPDGANSGAFLANSDKVIVIEAESLSLVTDWVWEQTARNTEEEGFTGDGYIRWNGPDIFTPTPTAGDANEIKIPFYIEDAGIWRVRLRMNHDSAGANDEENDVWLACPTAKDVGEDGYEKWGNEDTGAVWPNLGWSFTGFREPSVGVFDDLEFDLDAGNHELLITGRSQHGKIDRIHIYFESHTATDPLDITLPESQRAGGGGGGNVPATRLEMEAYLTNTHGVSQFRYVNNLTGSDSNPGTLAQPWLTIQHASNNLTPGQACIISGAGGRFYESVTIGGSGNSGQRIWYVGDPENPCIIDGTEAFNNAWTNVSGNMWRANYSRTRAEWFDPAYPTYCTSGFPQCADVIYHSSHCVVYQDDSMKVRQTGTIGVGAPTSLDEGECYFEQGTGSRAAPQYVWVRLPGDTDPNTVTSDIRVLSDKKWLFDYATNTWVEGYYGDYDSDTLHAGRYHIGLLNVHFNGCSTIIKRGIMAVRGTGWWVEWCSFRNGKHHGMTIHGGGHTIKNCKFDRNGQGSIRYDRVNWRADASGDILLERIFTTNGNWQDCPPNWEAGNKNTQGNYYGTMTIRECIFQEAGPGYWTDVVVGQGNANAVAVHIHHNVFENCARHAIFLEHNTEKHLVEHNLFWNTNAHEEEFQTLGAGYRCQAAGYNTLRNNAFVYNQGKGWYAKGHDNRGPVNNNVITDNVFVENCRDSNIDIQRVEFLGANGYNDGNPISGQEWRTSQIDGNVFFTTNAPNYFCRENDNAYVTSDSISTFQSFDWTNGENNVIAASAGVVVEDYTDRKLAAVTNHAGGSYPTKGPQNWVHPEDIQATQWTIPQ